MIKAGHLNRQYLHFYWRFKVLLIFLILCWTGKQQGYAQYYPIHATVQWPSPQSPYLSDYYSGSRDRLIVNLLNRDLQQPLLFARLRIKIKSTGFLATSREEISYPMLELSANVPTRLTNIDLSPYLQPQNLQINGRLRNGQLPTGYTEFSVQVVDYYTGRTLSDWHTGRSYLDVKKPPILNFPEKDAQIGVTEPLYLRFQWMPRHQGLAGTEYEFVLKELPNNGAAPQSAFAYGNEIYHVRTRNTTLNYTHLEPILFPNRCYAWQVQAIARDGVDEVGMFENGGYSEINWFYLNDNCQAPTGLRAHPRFAKVDLSWNKVIGTTGYIVECRPKTKLNTYEWSRIRIAGEHLTLSQLKLGWTYEWRVGTLCTDDRPVFSGVSEFTLSKQNDELLADCGKEPVRKDLSQEPNLRIKAGDIVTIGGDYPMTITEVVPLGDGWYSGRGKTRLKTIIDAPVALRFDRLRINVDNFQIDGTVEASYDEKKGKIANLDYVDDGGKDVKPATIRMREHKLDFTLPDIPQFTYNPETGEIETTDVDGTPHTIKIDVPENGSYERIFPMLVTDNKGNTYQISPSEQNTEGTGNDVETGRKDEKIELNCERVDRVGDFNTESLSSKYGYIHFKPGEGKYAFDDGQEKWYKKSVKVDRFYKPFAKGYIAPWKLVPVGENDIVMAKYDGLKNIDLKKVRFVSEPNSAALPARLNETEQTWTITLKSVSAGASYDVFAVYEGVVIGKLCVVSYDKHQHKITLVPINEVKLDKIAIEQGLNTIYNPVGVQFSVDIDERMRGNYDWEVESEKDGLLSTVGKSFWGYDKELKESTEMLNLQKTYQQAAGTLDGVYLFVLNGATGLEGQKGDLLGEMPRKSRFGYIFAGNSPNTASLVHTMAHEVGHGIFTLQHTFDAEYGKDTQGTTNNLLDYKDGTDIAAFQWNVMANPAVFTAMDKAKDIKIERYKSRMVCIPQDVSDAIMNSQKSLLSAKGDKIELPNGSIIKALFYSDTSIRPAPSGSIAEFEINGHSYKTWYRTHTKDFDSYSYTAKGDTVPWKIKFSNKEPVQIIINPANYTINVNGKIFLLDVDNFTCGDQRIYAMDLKSFYIKDTNAKYIRDGINDTKITLSKESDILNALKDKFNNLPQQGITTLDNFQKTLTMQFNYRGEGLTEKRKFVVLSTQVQKGNGIEEDWNALAQILFKELEFGDNDVLVTIPYIKIKRIDPLSINSNTITMYMPGVAYGIGTKLDKDCLNKKYDCTDGTVGKTGNGVGDFILSLFEQSEIPAIKPRVLIQTVTKPGFGLKEDRDEYEFEDAQGKGLTPASDKIAEDMKFGTSFDLSTIKDDKVRENLERLSKKSDDELFKNLINLAEWVSSGDLEDNNKRIIAEWQRQVYQTSEDHYTDSRLTDAVFKEETTHSLISEVKRLLHEALRVVNGDISRLSISNYIGQFNIKRPMFSSFSDKRHGLTFALNDTWGFKVTLLNYRYDATTKKYWAKLKFDVFDHFGLDKDDVVKFGSMEKVQDRVGKLAPVVPDSICQQAADGFCSWFILQYKRGYKPFVTMMSKEIEIEGRL